MYAAQSEYGFFIAIAAHSLLCVFRSALCVVHNPSCSVNGNISGLFISISHVNSLVGTLDKNLEYIVQACKHSGCHVNNHLIFFFTYSGCPLWVESSVPNTRVWYLVWLLQINSHVLIIFKVSVKSINYIVEYPSLLWWTWCISHL